ncbi:hypothetical protein L596_008795 [Steinernema carpocapsae]|uniref:Uncharacterized protein n=1 Tax=Steinernema carpocapsae TaxID=34508 RepID=A0A4U5PEC1_STECR|nr:hypothetical protein L596_008795 [Steinernema carpocapsae]
MSGRENSLLDSNASSTIIPWLSEVDPVNQLLTSDDNASTTSRTPLKPRYSTSCSGCTLTSEASIWTRDPAAAPILAFICVLIVFIAISTVVIVILCRRSRNQLLRNHPMNTASVINSNQSQFSGSAETRSNPPSLDSV